MKTCLPPRPHWSSPPAWQTSSTAAPIWGTVSLSRLPQRVVEPPVGYQLQLLLRL